MSPKRYFGLALVLVAVLAAVGFDRLGRDHQPRSYTVNFERGTQISAAGKRRVERIAAAMARQPDYSATVVGHTGTRGDPEANQRLGRDRARAVAQALESQGIAGGRIETFSAGGDEPLERGEAEGDRGYQARLSRASVRLNP